MFVVFRLPKCTYRPMLTAFSNSCEPVNYAHSIGSEVSSRSRNHSTTEWSGERSAGTKFSNACVPNGAGLGKLASSIWHADCDSFDSGSAANIARLGCSSTCRSDTSSTTGCQDSRVTTPVNNSTKGKHPRRPCRDNPAFSKLGQDTGRATAFNGLCHNAGLRQEVNGRIRPL